MTGVVFAVDAMKSQDQLRAFNVGVGRTFRIVQFGQNHLLSPSSTPSMGGSRHHRWKALGHPSQYTNAPCERHDEQWSSLFS